MKRITIFVTDKPDHVVLFTLFNNSKQTLPINVRIVSTIRKAAEYLGFAETDSKLLESALQNLKEG